ncbi:MAG: PD40 domain-containing protein [Candidatus Zixiibacteriota bacterium]|nr:MAG: PD40 domain-containing protein [candidate division Zixibacteria bacterium]
MMISIARKKRRGRMMVPFVSLLIQCGFVLCHIYSQAFGAGLDSSGSCNARIQYLGEKPPGMTPEVFAPGLVSTDQIEFGCTFSTDGCEFYFGRVIRDPFRKVVFVSRWTDTAWSVPELAPFSGVFDDELPRITPDGQFLFFTSNRPLPDMADQESRRSSFTVWVCQKTERGWGKPSPLAPHLRGMITVSATSTNTLYTRLRNGLVRMIPEHTGWSAPETFSIRGTEKPGNLYVAPDGSFLLFGCELPGYGMGDLWVSFRRGTDGWTEPANLGPKVNTSGIDAAPILTPDGDYLFFTSGGDIKWISADIIRNLAEDVIK